MNGPVSVGQSRVHEDAACLGGGVLLLWGTSK
jgi:hypothetical protein